VALATDVSSTGSSFNAGRVVPTNGASPAFLCAQITQSAMNVTELIESDEPKVDGWKDGDALMATLFATEPEVSPKCEITPEDLLAMPDGGHYELIDGELKERNVSFLSSQIAVKVSTILNIYCDQTGLGSVLDSELGYRCFPGKPKRVRRADVSFIRADRVTKQRLSEGYCSIPPDLAVEVVSPNDEIGELEEKIEEYLGAGIKLIWIVHPRLRAVHVFRADRSVSWLWESDELSGEDVIPGFRCRVGQFLPTAPQPQEPSLNANGADAAS
jgi:Uma2 family endonuclease